MSRFIKARIPRVYSEQTYASPYLIVRYPHLMRVRTAVQALKQASPSSVLDYGAGDGKVLSDAIPVLPASTTITAFEPVARFQTQLQQAAAAAGSADRIELVTDRAALDGRLFDYVICLGVLEHMPLRERLSFYELCDRCLTPDGCVLIDVPVEVGPTVLVKALARRALKGRGREYPLKELLWTAVGGIVFDPARFDPSDQRTWIQNHRGFDYRLLRRELANRFTIVAETVSPLPLLPAPLGNQEVYFTLRRMRSDPLRLSARLPQPRRVSRRQAVASPRHRGSRQYDPAMTDASRHAITAQRDYYAKTAVRYDEMHTRREHYDALRHVTGYLRTIGARTLLDTGCGTGMAMLYLEGEVEGLVTRGNDPSPELLRVATDRHGIAAERLDCVGSEDLPYEDGAFDAVIETGMLHHVPDPQRIVSEMLRVARMAVFISDSNIYGQGGSSLPSRVAKLALSRAGLLKPMLRRMRGGHEWYFQESDGVAWSYSLFDSYPLLREACAEVIVIPTGSKRQLADACPILFATHCLMAGFKEPVGGTPAR